MWRISLVNDKTNKPYLLDRPVDGPLVPMQTATVAPIRYSELFNFMGMLNGKKAELTLLPLEQFIERWKHALPYTLDPQAPTAGNVSQTIAKLRAFVDRHPEGIWQVET